MFGNLLTALCALQFFYLGYVTLALRYISKFKVKRGKTITYVKAFSFLPAGKNENACSSRDFWLLSTWWWLLAAWGDFSISRDGPSYHFDNVWFAKFVNFTRKLVKTGWNQHFWQFSPTFGKVPPPEVTKVTSLKSVRKNKNIIYSGWGVYYFKKWVFWHFCVFWWFLIFGQKVNFLRKTGTDFFDEL